MDHLRELQLVECDMLKQFDALCIRHHIDYFIVGGTALGAVRHKGFIPWDDDIDVGILRKDYERLKTAIKEDWKEKDLFLADAGSDLFYHYKIFSRIYKKNTIFETEDLWLRDVKQKGKERRPIWIDIFIYDYVDSKKEATIKVFLSLIMKRLYYFSKYQFYYIKGFKSIYKTITKNILHFILCLIKSKNIYMIHSKICKKEYGKYLCSFDPLDATAEKCFKIDEIFPLQRIPFEDFEVNAPCNLDVHLSRVYGNYMTLPSPEKRVGHLPTTIIFNTHTANTEAM